MTDLRTAPSPDSPDDALEPPRRGAVARSMVQLRSPLHRNAYALVLSGLLTSILGLLYWLIVARRYPAREVGIGSAAVSAMNLLANASALGLQNGFVRLIPSAGQDTRRFVHRAMILATAVAGVTSAVFLAGLRWWAPGLIPLLRESPWASAGFVVSVMLWSLFILQDNALIGLRRSTYVPIENLAFSLLKIVSVLVLSTTVVRWGVFASWGLSAAVAVVAVSGVLLPRLLTEAVALGRPSSLPRGADLRRHMLGEHTAVLLWLGAVEALPLLVLHRLGPVANAHYYLAVQIASGLFLLPSSFSVAMTAESASNPAALQQHLRKAAQHVGDLLVPIVAVVVVAAPLGLKAFGSSYSSEASSTLRLMALSALPLSMVQLMMSVARVQRRMRTVVLTYFSIGAILLTVTLLLIGRLGLVAVGVGWLVSMTVVALVVVPTQLRRCGIGLFDQWLGSVFHRPRRGVNRWLGSRQLARRLPVLAPALGSVRSVEVITSGNDVVVARVRSKDFPNRILKLADTRRAGDVLLTAAAAMASVRAAAPRIAPLIPVPVETGSLGDAETYLLEEERPGDPGLQRLLENRLSMASISSALGVLGELHRSTGHHRVVDVAWLDRWVDTPVSRLVDLCADADAVESLELIRLRLHDALDGRDIVTARIHGDVAPSNLLFALGGRELVGLLDWEYSTVDALPEIDVYQFLLSLHVTKPGVELDLAAPVLARRELHSITDRAVLEAAPWSTPNASLSPWTLTTMAWLSHVDSNLRKSERYEHSRRFRERNISSAAQRLAELAPSPAPPIGEPELNDLAVSVNGAVDLAAVDLDPADLVSADLVAPGPLAAHPLRRIEWPTSTPVLADEPVGLWHGRLSNARIVVPVAIGLWLLGIRGVDPDAMTDLGLLSILRPTAWLALGALLVGIVATVSRPSFTTRSISAHLVTFIALVHGTPALLYGTLRYSWAWKHVGIVDYILRTGKVDAHVDQLAVYHQWPGFFAAAGALTEAVGAENALGIAMLGPLFFNLVNLLLVVFVLSTLTQDRRVIWLGTTFFFVANWVGQDYFSPQAYAYVMHLAAIGLVLQRFSREDRNHVGRSWNTGWVTGVVCLLITAIATGHQLTPVMLAASLALLAVTRRAEVWKFVAFSLVINVLWAATYARPFVSEQLSAFVDRFGDVAGNAGDTLNDTSVQSSGQALVSLMGRVSLLVIGLLALAGFVRRWRAGRREWTAGLLAVAPAAALINSYGGEVLFRVVLFALPFLAYLAAQAVVPLLGRTWSPERYVAAFVTATILLTGYLFGYYGKERQYYFSSDEVAAVDYLEQVAPDNSLVVSLNANFPNFTDRYERFTIVPVTLERPEDLDGLLDAPVDSMTQWLDTDAYGATYLLISRAQLAEVVDVGEVPVARVLDFADQLENSPAFEKVFDTPDATILRIAASSTAGEG